MPGNPLLLGLAPGGTVDGSGIFLPPGRASRPAKICVILRGLPGSGKSHLARMIRSIERAHRGSARILSLDDYFLQEVSVEEAGKGGVPQRATKLEYQYEADMEAVYMASHLEAVRKTVTEGLFPVVVVDAVNSRLAHLQAFWALAREKGFQTYVVEMPRCLDVAKCADRNVHGWTADALEKLKEGWEPTPLHMARMVVEGLLGEKAIEEVEMGTEEEEEAEKEGAGSGEGRHRGKERGGNGGGRGVKAGMKRSRWEMEDEEEEGEGDKGTKARKSEGGGGERAETRDEKKVRWREVIDDLAVFDEREEVGCIHRESEHGMRGREGISVMQIRRRQVRRKEVKGKAGEKEGGKEGEVQVDGIRDTSSPNPTSMCLLWSLFLSLSTQFHLPLHGGPVSGDRPPSLPRPPSLLPFLVLPRIFPSALHLGYISLRGILSFLPSALAFFFSSGCSKAEGSGAGVEAPVFPAARPSGATRV